MTPTELCTVGKLLYGARWRSDLARSLGVTPRAVHFMITGESKIVLCHEIRMRELLLNRRRLIGAMLSNLSNGTAETLHETVKQN